MTDKVQKIREKVEKIAKSINPFIPDEDGKNSDYEAGKLDSAIQILQIIDSLEEPVSEDLKKAAEEYAYTNWASDDYHEGAAEGLPFDAIGHAEKCFKAGANWQKEQMMAKADNGRVDSVSNRQTRAHITVTFDSPRDIEVLDRLKVIVIKED